MGIIYILVRKFNQNSGSYAGMVEQFSKYASTFYKIKILCAKTDNKEKIHEKLPYGEVIRFSISKHKIPFLGMSTDYLVLAANVKKYFKNNPITNKDILFANGRASLGLKKGSYILRVGQPALYFLNNMELARKYSNLITRTARFIHFHILYLLEKRVVRRAKAYVFSSMQSRNRRRRSSKSGAGRASSS